MKMQTKPEYRVFWGRRFGHNQRRHIAQVTPEGHGRGWVSLYGTALCNVYVANYPENGELGKLENADCPRCQAKYRKLRVLYDSSDILTARTSPLGECTCEFIAVTERPGAFTRPETDRHCPVHNDHETAAYGEYLAAQENLAQAGERFEKACMAMGALSEARRSARPDWQCPSCQQRVTVTEAEHLRDAHGARS